MPRAVGSGRPAGKLVNLSAVRLRLWLFCDAAVAVHARPIPPERAGTAAAFANGSRAKLRLLDRVTDAITRWHVKEESEYQPDVEQAARRLNAAAEWEYRVLAGKLVDTLAQVGPRHMPILGASFLC